MRRPVILGGNPYIDDIYQKNARTLFDETGGNSGNLAFMFAIASHLRSSATLMPWGASPQTVRACGDVIILPLANQLGRHTDLESAALRLREFGLPVLGIGLGAQADTQGTSVQLSDGTMKWLATLAELTPSSGANLGVRGPFTKSQIDLLGFPNASVVTGCPSNFINSSADVAALVARGFSRPAKHIAVMAGIPFIPKLASIEQQLASIITLTGGAYIVQHGLEMLRLARNEFNEIERGTLDLARSYIAPDLSLDRFVAWCRQYAYAFYDARAWMDFVRRFDFVVGTRFHGAMLAIQAGVPAGCITHDSRTQEMCQTMGIPHCHYDEITTPLSLVNVRDYFKFDPEEYRAKRHNLAQSYVGLYRQADVAYNERLDAI